MLWIDNIDLFVAALLLPCLQGCSVTWRCAGI